ncbi:UDP-glucose 6-dehydrogenase [Geodia barretti]|uniref:UDP-glucose 6-dehydrogenase n=1 Tax=Geodia barretti TaxID=519541 RepID=A0AA35WT85_GEOBA|nr:UDP-glucose 6-dehydrogenase [Geodia barretti]
MKITVVGLGYVGTVAAAALAGAGHDVLGIDIDRSRTDMLGAGCVPMYEPGLEERIEAALRAGTLRFLHRDDVAEDPASSAGQALGDVALIATGTPPTHGGGADLHQVRAAVGWVKSTRPRELTVVMKSTVPHGTGTGRELLESELRGTSIRYASNPEFLREGRAVDDWEKPDRIVIGVEPDDTRSVDTVKRMYAGIDAPCMVTDITSAEMIKYASNAFLATRISFINEIASLCDTVGASIDERLLPLHALRQRFGGAIEGLRVGILGLAFKPGTDDVRDAPSLDLIRALVDEGAEVQAFDPEAMKSARPNLPSSVQLVEGVEEAANRTQALVLLTEWDSIVQSDWRVVARCMIPPRLVFDGRNALDPAEMNRLGFEYVGVGRGPVRGGIQDGSSPWSVMQGLVV